MTFHTRGLCLAALGVLAFAAPACAQENLDQGKSAQQLFASDCAICHKTPQGLAAKAGGMFGLDGFLREHYTASRQTAAVLAKYLQSVGGEPAPAENKRSNSSSSRRAAKPADKKSDDAKSGGKSDPKAESKPDSKADAKAADPKPEAKPEIKSEAKPESTAEPKTTDKPKSE
ncbi:MAG: hypothetical protein JSR72_00085 [Proteobacteria bacterium]|nr:hypothetical protein [Pseudomonadota bacterium]